MHQYDLVFLGIYVTETIMGIIALGLHKFSKDAWNIFNVLMWIVYALHMQYPTDVPFDISPVRVIRIVIILSYYIENL